MHKQTKAALVVSAGMAVTLIGLWPIANQPAKYAADETWADRVVAPVEPNEDEPGWNCLTDGNGSCGTLTFIADDRGQHDGFAAIQPVATDGVVYLAWPDGSVEPATRAQRELAWSVCVETADGGDASLEACDSDYSQPGDNFDMRTIG
jgi:hypothetical protein